MAKKFTFDDAITTDIKGAASNSYIDNIKMIKIADIESYYLKRITDYQDEIMKLLKSLLLAVTNAESENEESDKNNGG